MQPVYYIGLVQTIFAALLINKKKQKSKADIVLIIWLLVMGVEMTYSLLNITVLQSLPDLIIIPLTYGPFLYFYTKQLLRRESIFKPVLLLHFIPFVLLVFIAVIWEQPITVTAIGWLSMGSITYLSMANSLLFIASIFWYWLVVFKLINSHQQNLSNQFSFQSTSLRLDWVKRIAWWILGGFITSGLTYLFFIIANIFPFNPMAIFHISLLLFVFSIGYYGIHQPVIKQVKNRTQITSKHSNNFSNDELLRLETRIKNYMENEKPYLKGELTLEEMANGMNENIYDISYFLNHYLNKNFFTFINEYRVNEAKQRIQDPKNNNLTMVAIGYDSGFNSKSSFNSLFKKYTGTTPSEFKRKVAE